jgi:hypothetical protein
MTMPTPDQPNILEDPVNQNNVSFTLFQEILRHSHTRDELHRYWEVIVVEARLQQDLDEQRRLSLDEL